MIVLDASVLIAHLDATDGHHDRVGELLLAAGHDQHLRASPITLAEVLGGPARTGRVGHVMAALDQLQVRAVTLPPDAPRRLVTLRATTALKLPDCCVLLAADQGGHAVATIDDRLAEAVRGHGLAGWDR